ncbi:hypothetical protein EC2726800_4213 [Escherichia coli 2726800]|nr:hypothetical protein EC2726800_4213 [Escherichia coli 2726800]END38674.1 hypothetical protein EC2854350_3735 [Escherichia coli 2854350]
MSQFQIFINNSPKTTLIQREYWFPLFHLSKGFFFIPDESAI